MARNLKVLLGAAMALAALGALGVSAAQAHTPAQFHCHVEPCEATLEPDGAGTTAHHVINLRNSSGELLSFTCGSLTGHATASTKTPTSVEFTNLVYSNCKGGFFGNSFIVRTNGCKYSFTPAGTVTITGCNVNKKIEVEVEVPGEGKICIITVGEQGPLTGIKYHNQGTTGQSPASTRVTVEAKVPVIAATLDESAPGACLIDVTKTPITIEYTTGNTVVRGYKDGLAHTEANRVDAWWTATVA